MTCAVVFVDLPCECSLVVVSFLLLCALSACCCSCFLLGLFFFKVGVFGSVDQIGSSGFWGL